MAYRKHTRRAAVLSAALLSTGWTASAAAQQAPSAKPSEETQAQASTNDIIVTARRRNEDVLDTPVAVAAFSAVQLERAGVVGFADIARITPQLVVSTNVGTYGGFTALRGITSPTSNNAVDPAVLFVVNNVPVGTGAATRLGVFDVGQVEVLKGPQALYFGKNATGGIISVSGALPTREFEMMMRTEYEFNANEIVADGVISGPLTDDLLGRIAIRGNWMEGDQFNTIPGALADRGPDANDLSGRATLLFEPGSSWKIKATATYDHHRATAAAFGLQRTYCPLGIPQGPGVYPGQVDCKADKYFALANLPLNIGDRVGSDLLTNDGTQFADFKQKLFSLDASFNPVDGITLTSISGYYTLASKSAGHNVQGLPIIMVGQKSDRSIFSQEFRLASDNPASPFSWMIGGFYQHDKLHDFEKVVFSDASVTTLTNFPQSDWHVTGETLSGFAQASYKIAEPFTVSAGVRYTDESKSQRSNLSSRFIPRRKFSDLSPEVTLSYKPSPDTNLFASYKQGYKSGSFQVSSVAFAALVANPNIPVIDNSYNPESVEGFEGGFKAALFDRELRFDLTGYWYKYSDLQLSALDPQTAVNRISNAGKARIQGFEFNATYSPAFAEGLTLNAAAAFNDSKFEEFVAACFVGQTIAQGCTIDGADANTVPDLQNFAGRGLFKAPKWGVNLGANYTTDITDNLQLGLDARASYESKSFLTQEQIPWGIKPDTYLFDAGISLGAVNRSWEVSLKGKNLSKRRFGTHGIQEFRTGNGATTGTAVGQPADFTSYVSRGREIRLSITLRPGNY